MEDIAGIYARPLPDSDRHVQLGIASGKLVHVSVPETPDDGAEGEHELLDRIVAVFAEGEPEDFADVDVGLTVPTDRRAVLERLGRVRPGESVDVEALTRMAPRRDAESEDDRAAVREALRTNPAPIVIPDHRVDGVEGALPGEVRRRLREIEGLAP